MLEVLRSICASCPQALYIARSICASQATAPYAGVRPYTSQYFAGLCASPPQAIYIVHICFVFYVCIYASCIIWYLTCVCMRGIMATWHECPQATPLSRAPSIACDGAGAGLCSKWAIRFSTAWEEPVEKPVENSEWFGVWWTRSFPQHSHTFPQCCGKLSGWIMV